MPKPWKGVVVESVRMRNEFDALRDAGYFLVDIDAPEEFKRIKPGTPEHAHPTERDLDAYRARGRFDFRLWNDRSERSAYNLGLQILEAEKAWAAKK
jgi:hypothetical protein